MKLSTERVIEMYTRAVRSERLLISRAGLPGNRKRHERAVRRRTRLGCALRARGVSAVRMRGLFFGLLAAAMLLVGCCQVEPVCERFGLEGQPGGTIWFCEDLPPRADCNFEGVREVDGRMIYICPEQQAIVR